VRRVAVGTTVLLADINEDAAKTAATLNNRAGFQTATSKVDVFSAASVRALADTVAALGDVVAKRANVLRVQAESVIWDERGAPQLPEPWHHHDPARARRTQLARRGGVPRK
jgi:hypothetical protein